MDGITETRPESVASSPESSAPPVPVWDRLWSVEPSRHKDQRMLAREVRSRRWALLVDRLEATFGSLKGLRTVELGSGRGDLSVLLARRGASVTLLDASERALILARRRFDVLGLSASYLQGDLLRQSDILQRSFDVTLSSGVIEHFRGGQRTRAVRAHFEALRPGGMTVISVPNAWCVPYRLWKFYLETRGWWPYGMELPYSRRELVRRVREVGFARCEAQCLSFWHAVSSCWGRSLLGWDVDWTQRSSPLDASIGFVMLVFGWRGRGRMSLA